MASREGVRLEPDATVREAPLKDALSRRVIVEQISPEVDAGRFAIKRTAGERVDVAATVFADGHDVLTVVLRDRYAGLQTRGAEDPGAAVWRETPMAMPVPGTDRFVGAFEVDTIGWHEYQVVAWVDRFRTWRRDLQLKAAANRDVSLELLEGSMLVRDAASRAADAASRPTPEPTSEHAEWLLTQADALSESSPQADRVTAALGEELDRVMAEYTDRSRATASPARRVWVDRERARVGAWYEMFPRSAGPDPTRSATFLEAASRLPAIADLGF